MVRVVALINAWGISRLKVAVRLQWDLIVLSHRMTGLIVSAMIAGMLAVLAVHVVNVDIEWYRDLLRGSELTCNIRGCDGQRHW